MAMSLFRKNRDEGPDDKGDGGEGVKSSSPRDLRKARAWFDRAGTVADTRNYDYAIECFINGLKHDPDNLSQHESLIETGKRRMINKGKKAGFMEAMKSGGKDPIDRMLHIETVWAKDPLNAQHILSFMERALAVDEAHDDVNMGDVVEWAGGLFLESMGNSKRPDKNAYLKVSEILAQLGIWDKAILACRYALQLTDNDPNLLRRIKDLQAEQTMKEARYDEGSRQSVKNLDQQRDLEQQDQVGRSGSVIDEQIARRRAEYEEDPQDGDRVVKLVNVLVEKGTDASEGEAIKLLHDLWQQTGQYRYRMRIGDLKMRQYNRQLREFRKHLQANPDDEETKRIMLAHAQKQVQFELEEFTDRVKNYPTDLNARFQLGRRLHAVKKYDEAIAEFQQARADPKLRSQSLFYLGKCYLAKGWTDEAIDALQKGVAEAGNPTDKIALEMRYDLMDALAQSAEKNRSVDQAKEAQKTASELLQVDINFKDIRQRLEQIKQLVAELGGGGGSESSGGISGGGGGGSSGGGSGGASA